MPVKRGTKEERFLAREYALTGELEEVPGLGAKGIANLKSKGINTTYQLIGEFLRHGRSEQKMHDFLVEQGNISQHVQHTARTLRTRLSEVGFKCNIRLSGHVVKTATSMFDDSKKTAFLQHRLTQSLKQDFTGIRDESGFHRAGIRTTDQLFAAFLSIIDDPDPSKNTAKCDEFYQKLSALGAASGYKSVIIYQLQSKLAVGIDTHGTAALAASLPTLEEVDENSLTEEDFDAGRTVQRARTSPRRPREPPSPARPLFNDKKAAAAKETTPSSTSRFYLLAALPILVALVYYFGAAAQGPEALPAPTPTDTLAPPAEEGGTWL